MEIAARGFVGIILLVAMAAAGMMLSNMAALVSNVHFETAAIHAGEAWTMQVATDIRARQRLDDHPWDKHGTAAATALIALRACTPEVWLCPETEDNPEAFVLLCSDVEGTRTAIGVVSAIPRPGGEHVLLTHYIGGRYDDVKARLVARGCRPVANVNVNIQ